MSDLATIERVLELGTHNNADTLEIAKVLGWKIVVKKGEFQVGDLVVYIRTDTIVPDCPEFEFLRNKQFRVKPLRLRGTMSEGLLIPLRALPDIAGKFDLQTEGRDVASILGIEKYEKPIPACLSGEVKIAGLPYSISKTDEERVQNYPQLIEEIKGKDIVISQKMDGSSVTYVWKDGVFDVCGKTLTFKEGVNNSLWRMAHQLKLSEILSKINRNIAVRGELCGPGIQKNTAGFKDLTFCMFDIYDIDNRVYFDYAERMGWACEFSIPIAPVLWTGVFNKDLEWLENYAEEDNKYIRNDHRAEGIVVRPTQECYSPSLNSRLSFKVISKKYAEKE